MVHRPRATGPHSFFQRISPKRRRRLFFERLEERRVLAIDAALIQDIMAGGDSGPSGFMALGSNTYFSADDGTSGVELWRSDGSAASLFADLHPTLSSLPTLLTVANNRLFFAATTPATGKEVWGTDGVSAPQVFDVRAGSSTSLPESLISFNGEIYFVADNGTGKGLWHTDGIAAASLVAGTAGLNPSEMLVSGGKLYFAATPTAPPSFSRIYVYDGVSVQVLSITSGTGSYLPQRLVDFGGTPYFSGSRGSPTTGQELFKVTGPTSVDIVMDINPGSASSDPSKFTVAGTNLFFKAFNGTSTKLWRTHSGGTQLVSDPIGVTVPSTSSFASIGSLLYFVGTSAGVNGIYTSDGTTITSLPLTIGMSPDQLTNVAGTLYFAGTKAGINGRELWYLNGSTPTLVREIAAGSASSFPDSLTAVGSALYFSADDGSTGIEPWIAKDFPAPPAPTTTVGLDGSSNLVITDTAGGDTNDLLLLSRVGGNILVHDPVNPLAALAGSTLVDPHTVSTPISSISSNIQVNTLGGNDLLTVDSSVTTTAKPIFYSGGDPTSGPPGDALVLSGSGVFTDITHTFLSPSDGNVTIDGYPVVYTGLEPITDNLNVVNRVLTFTGGPETVTLANSGGAADMVSTISSTLAESVAFVNPTGSLTINLNGGDTFNFNSLDSLEGGGGPFSADLFINGAGGDTVNFPTSMINLGAGSGNVGIGGAIQTINFTGGGLQTTGSAFLTGTGSISDFGAGVVPIEIVALNLVAIGGAGVHLDTTVTSVEGGGGTGGVDIEESDDLAIGNISGVFGVSATGGNINLVARGDLTVNEDVVNSGGGTVTLTSASGSSADTLYGSDRSGNYFTVNLATGAGTFVGALPSGSTEIEYDPLSGRAFSQFPDGAFQGQEFDPSTGAGFGSNGPVPNGGSYTGLEWVGGTLYGTVIFAGPASPSELRVLNPFAGTSTLVGLTGVGPISGLAYDAAAGIMYGIAGGSAPANLYTINLSSGAATLVGNTGFRAGSLEFGPDGQLYAGGGGDVYRINTTTGASTFVGPAGFGTVTGLALIGPTGGEILYGSDRSGNYFTVNLATGTGTFVGVLPSGSTEIEYDPLSGRAFSQFPDGAFQGQEFNPLTGGVIGGPIPNGGSYTGLEWVGGTLYGTVIFAGGGASPSQLRILNPFAGTSTLVGPTGVGPISGLAYDAAAGIMYGIAGGPGPANLYTINLITGAATVVGNTGFRAGSLEFGPDGQLYAGGDADVYRINTTTGASTFVGPSGFGHVTGLALVGASGGAPSDLILNANVVSFGGSGNISLSAAANILHNVGTVFAANSGAIDYEASTATANGVITMADGTSATSGTGLMTLGADGNIQLSHVQTGNATNSAVMVTTSSGAITDADGGAALDINANGGGVILSAATGVGAAGSGPTIELDAMRLDVSNNTSGGIFVTDMAGGLTLDDLSGPTSVSGMGGNGLITANSPLTIAASATTSGGMTYTATDSAGAGDHLLILPGVAVTDTTASLTFNAGDDFILTNTASISAATTATINIDAGNADPGAGAFANIFGALAAPGGASMNGAADSDVFQVTGPTATALDGITAAVTVDGFGGGNILLLNDSLDVSGDTATVTHTTVEGLGGSPGTDYTYSNIAILDVTATSAGDILTTTLGGAVASPTSFNGLVSVNVRGSGGVDNMFLHVADSLTNASLDFVRLFGDAGGDNFGGAAAADHIRPVLATGQTQIIINGDANAKTTGPVNPGTDPVLTSPDRLFLDLTTTDSGATVNPVVIVDTNGGYADAANTVSFRYNGIEDIDLYDGGVLTNTAIGDFFVRATDNADYIQFMSAAQVNPVFRIRIGNIFYPTTGGNYGPYTTGGATPSRIFVYGRGGNDTITMYNTRLNAAVFCELGDDILTGGYGNDLIVGGAGNDRLNGAAVGGNDEIWGDDFNPATDDPAVASQAGTGNDQINTYGGNDTTYGQGGNDIINTGAGADYINGGQGGDQLDGQSGDDRIYGGSGVDVASGSEGNDFVAGGAGNDALYGRSGNDILIGGGGQDIVNGEDGSDVVVGDESNGAGSNSLARGDAADLALAALMALWGPTPTLASLGGFGSAGDDDFVDTLWGGAAADAFFATGSDLAADQGAPGYSPDLN